MVRIQKHSVNLFFFLTGDEEEDNDDVRSDDNDNWTCRHNDGTNDGMWAESAWHQSERK